MSIDFYMAMADLFTAVGINTFRGAAQAAKVLRNVSGWSNARDFQKGQAPIPRAETPLEDVESCVHMVEAQRRNWARTSSKKKADFLEQCLANMVKMTDEVARETVGVKGSYESGLGEEIAAWSSSCWIVRETIKAVKADFKPSVMRTRELEDKAGTRQLACQTFPSGLLGLVFLGMKGEVRLQPGKKLRQGKVEENEDGSVWLVLGAGNQIPVVVGDVLHCMFMCNSTVVLKMNPVNDYLGAFLETSFEPLIHHGYLKIVYGAAEVGKLLVNHPLVEAIHMTGSDKTFDAITWQGKPKPKDNKTKPPFTKPIHAELGCVTPYIIVPGNWSDSDLDFQARQCVSAKVHNAGHNCLALEVLVVPENWHLREKFMKRIQFHLAKSQKRISWYPQSKKSYERFLSKFPQAEQFGDFVEESGQAPWVMVSGLTPESASCDQENWCGVIQEVRIKSKSLPDYVSGVLDFCNNKLWGDLSCAILVDPKTQRNSKEEVEELISKLKYGSVAVNVPTHILFAIPSLTWGGYPGNTIYDIRSGNASVHNTACIQDIEKSVLYAPWKPPIYPVWNYDNVNLEKIATSMCKFFSYPSLSNFAALSLPALFGTP
jgi:acyl-CoA reductase-like NAD-dependent aldehyde dehydrogenase